MARFKDRRKRDEESLKSTRELIYRFPFVRESFFEDLAMTNACKLHQEPNSRKVNTFLCYIDSEKKNGGTWNPVSAAVCTQYLYSLTVKTMHE